MTNYVLDASVTAAWCFADERSPPTDALLADLILGASAHVPALWRWEVANLFVSGMRRGRLQSADVSAFCRMLDALPIVVAPIAETSAWGSVIALAGTHRLSAYDASYLDLALKLGIPLATKDNLLARAAATVGVALAL